MEETPSGPMRSSFRRKSERMEKRKRESMEGSGNEIEEKRDYL